jgi:ABC-2 type transport system permease protein
VIGTIRSEWIKLRTVRMNIVMVTIAVLAPLVIPALVAALGKVSSLDERQLFDSVAGSSVLSALLWSVIGATHITGEFAFNTIRPTFAATPRRARVILAKILVLAPATIIVQGVVTVGGLNLASSIATNRDVAIDYSAIDGYVPAALGIVLFAALVTLFGLAIGLIVRSSPAAVALVILWPLLVEGLLTGLLSAAGLHNVRRWMPYASGQRLWSTDSASSEAFGRVASGLYFAGFIVLLMALGTVLTNRRDA